MATKDYDFSGWATRNDIRCSDGRTIRKNAFKAQDGTMVPLVWNHGHSSANDVLGHALLENRDQGVYAYCSFNDTEQGKNAKELVKHGDICALSIYANQLKQNGGDVIHGAIREVSLVLAGANPGAYIEDIVAHSESDEGYEATIFNPADGRIVLSHSFDGIDKLKPEPKAAESKPKEDSKMADEKLAENTGKEETVKDVFDTLTDKQKTVVYAIIGQALENAKKEGNATKEGETVKHNAFENETTEDNNTLSHAEFMEVINDAKKGGLLSDAFLAHGITNIDYLFPDARNLEKVPPFINTHPNGWVAKIKNGVHHSPFSRVKMMFADITGDEARARGYIKGNQKVDEVFSLLKRTVDPTTVYKKQSFDRDDVIDITDFDVIPWVKAEMRDKLDEELARAFIFGDGRASSSNDKINETKIIPVVKDTTDNLYAMAYTVKIPTGGDLATAMMEQMVKSLDDYEGAGNVTLFLASSTVSDMLLLKDTNKHRLYKDVNELATAMNVSEVVKVPASILPDGVVGVALDLADYNVGADKGGAVNTFDDFDIDYNKMKYLIETRCSGALTKPHSAIVLNYTAGE